MSFELIISISAIFIALSSLIVAIWQNILTRKHNKLSVKPLICIDYHFTDDEELNGIYLDNTGLGPAIIKSFRVFIDEDEILQSDYELWEGAIKKLEFPPNINLKIFVLLKESVIYPNDKKCLIGINSMVEPSDYQQYFYNALRRIDFKLEYESIYEEKFSQNVSGLQLPG